MKKNALLPLFLSALLFGGCTPPNKAIEPEALPRETLDQVNQNLRNGIIPAPGAVKENAVAPAADACEKFIAKLPQDWFREKLEVPENPADPQGRKIKVFYYGKIYPQSTPTIFFNGGPGADSHGSYSGFKYNKETFDPKNKISFIFIDQRGNGCSDFYPQGKTEEIIARLSHYGSKGIVSDSEYVRKKLLQDKRWNAFGQSYGGHIVHRYLIQAPLGLKAGFSHANIVQSSGYERTKNRIASQVRVQKEYFAQFPEDKTKLEILKNYLTLERCYKNPYDKEDEACGHTVLESFNSLVGFSESWLSLHQWVGIMVKDDKVSDEDIGRYLAAFYFDVDNSNPLNVKSWAHQVISWVDRNVEGMSGYNCQKIRNDLGKEGIDLNGAFLHECMSMLQYYKDPLDQPIEDSPTRKLIKQLPRDHMSLDQLHDALVEHPETLLYLYSGQRDTFVPLENFREEVALLKGFQNVFYTHFNGTGHDGFSSEPKVWADLQKQSEPDGN